MGHISYYKSIEILKANLPIQKGIEVVSLDKAVGRVLGEDIVAPYNNPYHPTASMDGYAIRWEEREMLLQIVGENPAGQFNLKELPPKSAIKTFTGSFMPAGSDTLIPFENGVMEGNILKVLQPVPKGFSVRPVGEDFKKGEVVIPAGTVIKEGEIGVLASLGKSVVPVIRKPKIGIIATGEELVEVDTPFKKGQIRSSNHWTLTALARRLGFEVVNRGLIGDNPDEIERAVEEGLEEWDIVVTTGGVSVGDYDFIKGIGKGLGRKGLKTLFHGVNIKPGQWIMVSKLDPFGKEEKKGNRDNGKMGKENKKANIQPPIKRKKGQERFLVSLPGFPYSSFVTFLLYVVPLAEAFEGRKVLMKVQGRLLHQFQKVFKKHQFVPVDIYYQNGEFLVDFRRKKIGSSGILTNLIGCAGLMELPEGIYNLEKGTEVSLLLFSFPI